MSTTVAIQGAEASFHAIAARQYFGEDISIISCDNFDDTFRAIGKPETDYGVVAIENSLFGSINKVYDLLLKHGYFICGEVYLRVAQCLIGLPGAKLQDITEVHSQAEALAQCETFLDAHLPRAARLEHHDTAASVADIKKWGDVHKAAIASRQAAELHGLDILADEIESNKQNYTRFVVVRKQKSVPNTANKTSLIITMSADNKPGALYRALGVFASRDINLLLLHSRPIVGRAWHYMFYIDVAENLEKTIMTEAIKELESQDCRVIILGSYRAGHN